MVWRLPHMGQGIGVEYTVACHSMSRASKTWPQSSHLNFFFPLIIVVNVSKLDMLCKDRLFIINVQGKRKKNIVLSFKFNICRNKSSCVCAHITDYLDLPIFIHSCRLPHVFLRIVVCHQEYQWVGETGLELGGKFIVILATVKHNNADEQNHCTCLCK